MPANHDIKIRNHLALIISSLVSLILLIILLYLKSRDYAFLDLDIKWLLVAGLPILLCLFIANYIKSFKGFGVELEAKLEEAIPPSFYKHADYDRVITLDKGSVDTLDNLGPEKRMITDVLSFKLNYDAYTPNDVKQHLEKLPNLKYIQVTDSEGKFKFLLPINILRSGQPQREQLIQNFIYNINNNHFTTDYNDLIVTGHAAKNDSIIEVYKKIRKENASFAVLPVLDDQDKLIGIIEKSKIDALIADEVMEQIM